MNPIPIRSRTPRHRLERRHHPRHRRRARSALRRVSTWAPLIAMVSLVAILLLVGPASAMPSEHLRSLNSTPALTTVIPNPPTVNDLPTVIRNARNWFIGILSAVMLFFFTLGAARYIAAGSDPSETERAKGLMKGSVLGYVLGMMASVVLAIVQQIIGV